MQHSCCLVTLALSVGATQQWQPTVGTSHPSSWHPPGGMGAPTPRCTLLAPPTPGPACKGPLAAYSCCRSATVAPPQASPASTVDRDVLRAAVLHRLTAAVLHRLASTVAVGYKCEPTAHNGATPKGWGGGYNCRHYDLSCTLLGSSAAHALPARCIAVQPLNCLHSTPLWLFHLGMLWASVGCIPPEYVHMALTAHSIGMLGASHDAPRLSTIGQLPSRHPQHSAAAPASATWFAHLHHSPSNPAIMHTSPSHLPPSPILSRPTLRQHSAAAAGAGLQFWQCQWQACCAAAQARWLRADGAKGCAHCTGGNHAPPTLGHQALPVRSALIHLDAKPCMRVLPRCQCAPNPADRRHSLRPAPSSLVM